MKLEQRTARSSKTIIVSALWLIWFYLIYACVVIDKNLKELNAMEKQEMLYKIQSMEKKPDIEGAVRNRIEEIKSLNERQFCDYQECLSALVDLLFYNSKNTKYLTWDCYQDCMGRVAEKIERIKDDFQIINNRFLRQDINLTPEQKLSPLNLKCSPIELVAQKMFLTDATQRALELYNGLKGCIVVMDFNDRLVITNQVRLIEENEKWVKKLKNDSMMLLSEIKKDEIEYSNFDQAVKSSDAVTEETHQRNEEIELLERRLARNFIIKETIPFIMWLLDQKIAFGIAELCTGFVLFRKTFLKV